MPSAKTGTGVMMIFRGSGYHRPGPGDLPERISVPETEPVRSARSAVERGFNPIPLWPLTKKPVPSNWTALAPDGAVEAFSQALERAKERDLTAPLNVGLVLSPSVVDIDLDHHRAIRLARRLLPPTSMKHGRASARDSHWWYRVSDDYDPGVKAYRLPDLDGRVGSTIIEYRSTGGQTMIPPSTHPETSEELFWSGDPFGGEEGPSEVGGKTLHARVALIALLVTLAEAWPTRGGRHDAYLALVGGLLRDADEDGNPRLQPFWAGQIEGFIALLAELTHDEDGAQSRIHESVPTTRRKIPAGGKVRGWPTLARMMGENGAAYVARIREIAADIEHLNGTTRYKIVRYREEDEWWEPADPKVSTLQKVDEPDEGGLLDEVEEAEPEEQRGTWEIITEHDRWLDAAHNLTSPIMPGVITRADGLGLMYPGRVNMIYGPSESGKTLIALAAAVEEVARGGRVLMVDLENGYDEMHERLQSLGLPAGMRTPGWAYIEAEQPISSLQRDSWGGEDSSPTGRANRERFLRGVREFDPTLILLDGTTTLFTMHGLDPNKATGVDTITSWLRRICEHGKRTAVLIDHTNKNPKVGDLPTGSQHKKSMVQGTMLQVHGESPEPGSTAFSMLFATKDRPGKVKRDGLKEQGETRVADVVFESSEDGFLQITFTEPDPEAQILDLTQSRGPGRPKADTSPDDAAILGVIRNAGPGTLVSRSQIEKGLPHPIPQGRIKAALGRLADSGRIEKHGLGRSTAYTVPG